MAEKLRKIFNKKGSALMTVVMVMIVLTTIGTVFAAVVFSYYQKEKSSALGSASDYEVKAIVDSLSKSIMKNEKYLFEGESEPMTINEHFRQIRKDSEIPEDTDEIEYFEKNPIILKGDVDGDKNKSYKMQLAADGLSIKISVTIKGKGGHISTLSSTVKLLLDGFTNDELKENMQKIFDQSPTYYVYEKKNLCTKNNCGFQLDYWQFYTAHKSIGFVPPHLHIAVRGDTQVNEPICVSFAPGEGLMNVENGKKVEYYQDIRNTDLHDGVANKKYVNAGAYLAIDYNASTGIKADIIVNGPCTIMGGVRADAKLDDDKSYVSTNPLKKPGELGGSLIVNGDCTIYNQNIGGNAIINGNFVMVNSILGWSEEYYNLFGINRNGVMHKINGTFYATQTEALFDNETGYALIRDGALRIEYDFFTRDHFYSEGIPRGTFVAGSTLKGAGTNYTYCGGDFVVLNNNFEGNTAKQALNLSPTDVNFDTNGRGKFTNKQFTSMYGSISVQKNLYADTASFEISGSDVANNPTDTQMFIGGGVTLIDCRIDKSKRFWVGMGGNGDFYMEGGYFRGEMFDNATSTPSRRHGVDSSGNIVFYNVADYGGGKSSIRVDHLYAKGNITLTNCDTELVKYVRAGGDFVINGSANRGVHTRFKQIKVDASVSVTENTFGILTGYNVGVDGIEAGENVYISNSLGGFSSVPTGSGLGSVKAGGFVEISNMNGKLDTEIYFDGILANGNISIDNCEFYVRSGYSLVSVRGSVFVKQYESKMLGNISAYKDVVVEVGNGYNGEPPTANVIMGNVGNIKSVSGSVYVNRGRLNFSQVSAKGAIVLRDLVCNSIGQLSSNDGSIAGSGTYGIYLKNISPDGGYAEGLYTQLGNIKTTGSAYLFNVKGYLSGEGVRVDVGGNFEAVQSAISSNAMLKSTTLNVKGQLKIEGTSSDISAPRKGVDFRFYEITVGGGVFLKNAVLWAEYYNLNGKVSCIDFCSLNSLGNQSKGYLKFGVTREVQSVIEITNSVIAFLNVETKTSLNLVQTFGQRVERYTVLGNLRLSQLEDAGFLRDYGGVNKGRGLFRYEPCTWDSGKMSPSNDVEEYYVDGNFTMENVYSTYGRTNDFRTTSFYAYVTGDMLAEKNGDARSDGSQANGKNFLPMIGASILGRLTIRNYEIDKTEGSTDFGGLSEGGWAKAHGGSYDNSSAGGHYNWVIGKTMRVENSSSNILRLWKTGRFFVNNVDNEAVAASFSNFLLFKYEATEGNANAIRGIWGRTRGVFYAKVGRIVMDNSGIVDNVDIADIPSGDRYERGFWHQGSDEYTVGIYSGEGNVIRYLGYGRNPLTTKPILEAFDMVNVGKRLKRYETAGNVAAENVIAYAEPDNNAGNQSNRKMNYTVSVGIAKDVSANDVSKDSDYFYENIEDIGLEVSEAPMNYAFNWNDFAENDADGNSIKNYFYYQQQSHDDISGKKTVPLQWRIPSDKYAPGINTVFTLGEPQVKRRLVSRYRKYAPYSIYSSWSKPFQDVLQEWYTTQNNYVIDKSCTFPLNPNDTENGGLTWKFYTEENTIGSGVSISFDPQGADLHIKIPKGMTFDFGAGVHFDVISTGRVFLYMQSDFTMLTSGDTSTADKNKAVIGAQAYSSFAKQNDYLQVRQGGTTQSGYYANRPIFGGRVNAGVITQRYLDSWDAWNNYDRGVKNKNQIFFIGNGKNIQINLEATRISTYIYMPYADAGSKVILENFVIDSDQVLYDRFNFYGGIVAQEIRFLGYARAIVPDMPVDLDGLDFLYLQNLPAGSSGEGQFNGFDYGWVFEGYS